MQVSIVEDGFSETFELFLAIRAVNKGIFAKWAIKELEQVRANQKFRRGL